MEKAICFGWSKLNFSSNLADLRKYFFRYLKPIENAVLIQIKQKPISLTDEYEIFIGEDLFYTAVSKPFKQTAKIDIFSAATNSQIMKIAKQNFGIRANYLIQFFDGEEIYSLEEINNIKLTFKCQIKDDLYQLYGHNGNKFSIFKNQKQIGFWEKNNFIFGERDFYNLTANDNESPVLLSAFCICIDNAKNNFQNELSLLNFDIGFKGNLLRKFDENWKPNSCE